MAFLHITDRYMKESTLLLSLRFRLKEENNIIRIIKKKRTRRLSGNTRARGRPTGQASPSSVFCATWPLQRSPCYVSLAPPTCVLKVCHWVKVARAAEWRGVAGKWVTWANTRLRTLSSFDAHSKEELSHSERPAAASYSCLPVSDSDICSSTVGRWL